jgi:hypothetical protein
VLEVLERDFVNAWILQQDLDALADDRTLAPELRKVVVQIRDGGRKHRLFPVGIHVLRADGELCAKGAVNELMGGRMAERYLKVLAEGLATFRQ